MKKLLIKFNSHPSGTLEKVLGLTSALGLVIEEIQDLRKSKHIVHKLVTVVGEAEDLKKLNEALIRVPSVTIREQAVSRCEEGNSPSCH